MVLQGSFGPVKQEQKGPLANVASSAERLSGIVNDMLDIASLQNGKMKLTLTTFALDGVVQEVVASLQPLARNKNLTLEAKNSSSTMVVADRDRTKQILINLLGNALKFTDKGGISISSEAGDKLIKVLVANTGPAIPPDKQKMLFHKFEQLSNKPGGTGLGLSIARELARAMGGDLWLEKSVEGGETVFAFSLPVASMVPLKES
jgi:signal transduction histidine kinase